MKFANAYHSQFEGYFFLTYQTLFQGLLLHLRPYSRESIVFGFQQLVQKLVYGGNGFRHAAHVVYSLYRRCYRRVFQEKNGSDCNISGYHTYGKHITRLENLKMLFRMLYGVRVFHASHLSTMIARILLCDENPSNSNIHEDRAYQLSPRSAQYRLQYTYCACRVPFDVPNPGRLTRVAGTLI